MNSPYLYMVLVIMQLCTSSVNSQSTETYDVLILGGGMAGVAAALTLQKHGVNNFLLIEARSTVGGRVQSGQVGGYVVEGGAFWVHAASEKNPIYTQALKHGMTLEVTDYDHWQVFDENGHNVTEQADAAYDVLLETVDRMENFKTNKVDNLTDISVRSALRMLDFNPDTPVENLCEYFEFDFDTAQRPDITSFLHIGRSYEDLGDGEFVLLSKDKLGYAMIALSMMDEKITDWKQKTQFETIVKTINYTKDGVNVETSEGIFKGKTAIVTFSLGVLQQHEVKFYPAFPTWKEEAIQSFQIGQYFHFYMKFPSSITWFVPDNVEWIGFPSRRRGFYPLWFNMNKYWPGCHIIQGMLTDQEAIEVEKLSDQEIQSEAMSILRMMFGPDLPDPEDFFAHRFHNDPLFYGAYSSWPVGFTASQHEALTSHLNPLFFAGEAFSTDFYGFVHGAFLNGEEVAETVIQCLHDKSKCPHTYVPSAENTEALKSEATEQETIHASDEL